MEINTNANAPVIMPAMPEGGREPPRDTEVPNAVRETPSTAAAENDTRPSEGNNVERRPSADSQVGSRLDVTA